MAPPNEPATNEEVERIDDPDLEASLDEPATEDGEEVFAAVREMIAAIGRAVALAYGSLLSGAASTPRSSRTSRR
jgi:hypothetical protein